ncbi:PAS domain S-box-containing protein [Thiogranum longum]|uniref:PAS domain S-box-containing protein n=1 Tax=Thiogranum longum TaxID=1537524 RepID=A0A4V2PGY0_9GAMM|nr:sigma 54-interacting transcriptional regulator [Thiogranum longum]TCK18536.1 PAS domain S-box-containing protein [Thiogranum longum]
MKTLEQFAPLMDAVIAHIHEGVILTDYKGKILFHNPAADELLGFTDFDSVSDIQACTGIDLQKSLTTAANSSLAMDHLPVGRHHFEQRITRNGKTRFLEVNTSTVPVPGKPSPVHLMVMSDITDRRRLQAVLNDERSAGLITQDPHMIEISVMMEQIASTCASVLLQGESGTGKSLIARMVHEMSDRSSEPLVEINCAAIPDALLESELFGHVKGAFTGATQDRKGRLQSAHGGTLFLDEISELPLHLQPKLLKALEEQTFQMVGSDKNINVDVRIIVASNQNLRELVDAGDFRADLYYRLAVIPVEIPALRERPGDIPLLVHYICDQLVSRGYPDNIECDYDAMQMMMNYPWPGNVRELNNAVEHGMILARNGRVSPDCLPFDIRHHRNNCEVRTRTNTASTESDPHKKEILDALAVTNGNRAKAARNLGIDRSTLWRRMHRLNLI